MKKNQQNQNKPIIYRFDATDEPIGRIASKIAAVLQGKLLPAYNPSEILNIKVVVQNAGKMVVTGKKMKEKKYFRYTGYPGGIKSKTMGEYFESSPEELLKKVIRNMLPKNRLRSKMLKRIQFKK